ncbi:hypothetical protein [Helicobacter pametensis]|uniref:hypothetical protein n=1 Tax=Helicobacter pametensis TaxID=95149 RepID=UPI0012EC6188|nr:hypothetical protein [Helicobacter pametensis]
MEALFALIVFAVVVVTCSQTLLQIHKDSKVYQEAHIANAQLSSAVFYLQRLIQNSLLSKLSPDLIELFEINRDLFLKDTFRAILKTCQSNRISKLGDTSYVGMFSEKLEIAKVLGREGDELILDRKAQCGVIVPLREKRQIVFTGGKVYLDRWVLLDGVREFEISQTNGIYQIRICTSVCLVRQFLHHEVVHVL